MQYELLDETNTPVGSPHYKEQITRKEWNGLFAKNKHPKTAILKGEAEGFPVILVCSDEPVTLGRSESNDIVIYSQYVSRKQHCLLYPSKGKLYIKDTSSYGTVVKREEKIRAGPWGLVDKNTVTLKGNTEPFELKSEDIIIFGGEAEDAAKLDLIIIET
ncbi:FHA domain-containing protein [Candidatus Woesearchaeota archaeon]|nr:FHA domain-containing protein [Candidatus Woesearchaeota archaeon]